MHSMFGGNAWWYSVAMIQHLSLSFFCFCNATFFHSGYVIKPPQPSSAIYGAPSFTGNQSESKLCPYVCHERCIWLPAFFSYFFSASLFVSSVAFWCHPSSCCEDKGIEWRLLNVHHSLVVLTTYPSLFSE